ncbi:DUF6403 family protein [Symbioplanes lichenis]|uniref:DUF6403 family protein n=1 Tax=Symbioplanes lichenis TaxID=1629072 RepID=UPI0027399455|nr:DUF6403 family protein [Actinoplanes lichenis]
MVWAIGVAVLVAAGFAGVVLPSRRKQAAARRTAWSEAHAAIAAAQVTRDGCATPVAEAEHLLARAEAIAAARGGEHAAAEAARLARAADLQWREAGE